MKNYQRILISPCFADPTGGQTVLNLIMQQSSGRAKRPSLPTVFPPVSILYLLFLNSGSTSISRSTQKSFRDYVNIRNAKITGLCQRPPPAGGA